MRIREQMKERGAGQRSTKAKSCPGCGNPVPATRKYCKPSCRLKAEHRQQEPRLFPEPLTWESEWPPKEDR
jgi:predicted amidophosphoribosyltransferase